MSLETDWFSAVRRRKDTLRVCCCAQWWKTATMKVVLMFERWHRNFLISEIGKVYGGLIFPLFCVRDKMWCWWESSHVEHTPGVSWRRWRCDWNDFKFSLNQFSRFSSRGSPLISFFSLTQLSHRLCTMSTLISLLLCFSHSSIRFVSQFHFTLSDISHIDVRI